MTKFTAILTAQLKEAIDEDYLPKLNNVNLQNNEKTMIVYSATAGVGKTSLSAKTQAKTNAVLLSNDEMRHSILKVLGSGVALDALNPIVWKYSMSVFERVNHTSPNGIIIRDAIIDWYYDRLLPMFIEAGHRIYVIGFDISPELNQQQIISRGPNVASTVERQLAKLPHQREKVNQFRRKHDVDFIIKDEHFDKWDEIADMIVADMGLLDNKVHS